MSSSAGPAPGDELIGEKRRGRKAAKRGGEEKGTIGSPSKKRAYWSGVEQKDFSGRGSALKKEEASSSSQVSKEESLNKGRKSRGHKITESTSTLRISSFKLF